MTNIKNPDDYPDSGEYVDAIEEWLHNEAEDTVVALCQAASTGHVPAHIADPTITAPDDYLEWIGNDMTDDAAEDLRVHLIEVVDAVYQTRAAYWEEACEWAHSWNMGAAMDYCSDRYGTGIPL